MPDHSMTKAEEQAERREIASTHAGHYDDCGHIACKAAREYDNDPPAAHWREVLADPEAV